MSIGEDFEKSSNGNEEDVNTSTNEITTLDPNDSSVPNCIPIQPETNEITSLPPNDAISDGNHPECDPTNTESSNIQTEKEISSNLTNGLEQLETIASQISVNTEESIQSNQDIPQQNSEEIQNEITENQQINEPSEETEPNSTPPPDESSTITEEKSANQNEDSNPPEETKSQENIEKEEIKKEITQQFQAILPSPLNLKTEEEKKFDSPQFSSTLPSRFTPKEPIQESKSSRFSKTINRDRHNKSYRVPVYEPAPLNPYSQPCSPRLFNTKIETITSSHPNKLLLGQDETSEKITANIKQKALKKEPLGKKSPAFFESLHKELVNDRETAVEKGQYRKVSQYNAAISYVGTLKIQAQKQYLKQNASQLYKEDIEAIKKALSDYDNETNEHLKEIQKKHKEMQDDFKARQEADQKDFLANWQADSKLREYNHASVTLLLKRKQLATNYQMKNFDQVEILTCQVKELEAKESDEAQRTMKRDYKIASQKFKEKQREESERFDKMCDFEKDTYLAKRNQEREILLHMINKVESKNAAVKDQERLWSACKMRRIEEELVHSPSSQSKNKKKNAFPNELNSKKINLPPLNFKDL